MRRAPPRYRTFAEAVEAGWASYARASGLRLDATMVTEITSHIVAALARTTPDTPPPPPANPPRVWWQD